MTSSCSCEASNHCLCEMDEFLVFAAEGNTWMKARLGLQSDTVATQLCSWVAGISCVCRCKVQLPLVIKYQGWALLSRWNVECLWSPVFGWPVVPLSTFCDPYEQYPRVLGDCTPLVERCLPFLGTHSCVQQNCLSSCFPSYKEQLLKHLEGFPPPLCMK